MKEKTRKERGKLRKRGKKRKYCGEKKTSYTHSSFEKGHLGIEKLFFKR